MGPGSRQENASKRKTRASVPIQSERNGLWAKRAAQRRQQNRYVLIGETATRLAGCGKFHVDLSRIQSPSATRSNGVTGNLMPKTMIKPGPDLLRRVNQAFLDYGYSGLSMVTMAKACGFTQRAPSDGSIPNR